MPADELVEWYWLAPSRLHWKRAVRVSGAGQGWNATTLLVAWVAPASRHIPYAAPDGSEWISLRYRSPVKPNCCRLLPLQVCMVTWVPAAGVFEAPASMHWSPSVDVS